MISNTKSGRFTEGESVDVAEYLRDHGNPEAADDWDAMNEEHGDKFKKASSDQDLLDPVYDFASAMSRINGVKDANVDDWAVLSHSPFAADVTIWVTVDPNVGGRITNTLKAWARQNQKKFFGIESVTITPPRGNYPSDFGGAGYSRGPKTYPPYQVDVYFNNQGWGPDQYDDVLHGRIPRSETAISTREPEQMSLLANKTLAQLERLAGVSITAHKIMAGPPDATGRGWERTKNPPGWVWYSEAVHYRVDEVHDSMGVYYTLMAGMMNGGSYMYDSPAQWDTPQEAFKAASTWWKEGLSAHPKGRRIGMDESKMAEGCPDNLDESECKDWEANTEKYKDNFKTAMLDPHEVATAMERWVYQYEGIPHKSFALERMLNDAALTKFLMEQWTPLYKTQYRKFFRNPGAIRPLVLGWLKNYTGKEGANAGIMDALRRLAGHLPEVKDDPPHETASILPGDDAANGLDKQAGKYLEVTPAYGRDYKTQAEAKAAWDAGKDFILQDISSPWDGKPINKEDAKNGGYTTVNIRFKRNTQVAVVKLASYSSEDLLADLARTAGHVPRGQGTSPQIPYTLIYDSGKQEGPFRGVIEAKAVARKSMANGARAWVAIVRGSSIPSAPSASPEWMMLQGGIWEPVHNKSISDLPRTASDHDDLLAELGILSRYEEGEPADPTENMSPEDAKTWRDNTEEHKDKFKKAHSTRIAWESGEREDPEDPDDASYDGPRPDNIAMNLAQSSLEGIANDLRKDAKDFERILKPGFPDVKFEVEVNDNEYREEFEVYLTISGGADLSDEPDENGFNELDRVLGALEKHNKIHDLKDITDGYSFELWGGTGELLVSATWKHGNWVQLSGMKTDVADPDDFMDKAERVYERALHQNRSDQRDWRDHIRLDDPRRMASSPDLTLAFLHRMAEVFPTQNALDKYLKDHPKADKANHSVQKSEPKNDGESKDKGSGDLSSRQIDISHPDLKSLPDDAKVKDLKPDQRAEIEGYDLEVVGDNAKRAVAVARLIKDGLDKLDPDLCKEQKPLCKGNMRLTRDKMPQVESDSSIKKLQDSKDPSDQAKAKAMIQAGGDPDNDKPVLRQMADFLAKNGVKTRKVKMPVGKLKATQKEIKTAKSFSMANSHLKNDFKGKAYSLTDGNPIIVSRDNHILDGHHRWAAGLIVDPGMEFEVEQIDMDMEDLLKEAAAFPGVYKANFKGDPLPEEDQKKYKAENKSRFTKGGTDKKGSHHVYA